MAKFAYINTKNANIDYTPFEFNCKYHSCIFYEKNFDSRSKSKTTKKISFKLQDLIATYLQNFYYIQKLQK